MSHLIRVILIVGLSVAAVLIILFSTGHFGPQEQMDAFVARTLRSALDHDVTIEEYVEASMPRRFQRDMIKAWFQRPVLHSLTLASAWGQPISVISVTDPITY